MTEAIPVFPPLTGRINRNFPAATFLSCAMRSRIAGVAGSPSSRVGSPHRFSSSSTRTGRSFSHNRNEALTLAAHTSPTPTAHTAHSIPAAEVRRRLRRRGPIRDPTAAADSTTGAGATEVPTTRR